MEFNERETMEGIKRGTSQELNNQSFSSSFYACSIVLNIVHLVVSVV
jgi:hypothetical protein